MRAITFWLKRYLSVREGPRGVRAVRARGLHFLHPSVGGTHAKALH